MTDRKTTGSHANSATAGCAVMGACLLACSALATTWELDVPSGTKSETGTIPAGTTAISKTGSGTYELNNSGTSSFNGTATVAGTLRIQNGTLDMGGGTITKKGAGWFQLWNLALANLGDFDVSAGYLDLYGSTSLSGGSSRKITVSGTALRLNYMSASAPVTWAVELAGGSLIGLNGSTSRPNYVDGPITASANYTLSSDGALTLRGGLTATDGLVCYKDGAGIVRIGCAAKTDSTVWIKNGLLVYGDEADATSHVPSVEPNASVRSAIKVEPGARVSWNGKGAGHASLGFGNYGAFWMTGGTVDLTEDWGARVGQTGGADMYVGGGTMSLYANVAAHKARHFVLGNDANNATAGNPYTVTVDGANTELRVRGLLYANAANAVLNVINGGTLGAESIYKGANGTGFTLNFDGGILKPTYYGSVMSDTANSPAVLVQDGGLVVDTVDTVGDDGKGSYSQIYASLQKPTGKCIASIDLPTDLPSNINYFSPAPVRITGTGIGASAFVEIDEATRKPSRIIVTGKGSGYDETTAVTIDSPDGASRYTCPVTLETPAGTGSFTKRGVNSLVLYGNNTYGGATILEGGWTKFSGENAYPAGSPLVVKSGAHFQTENRTAALVVPSVAGCGSIVDLPGGLKVTGEFIVDLADLRAGRKLTCDTDVTLADGAMIKVVDSEGLWTCPKTKIVTLGSGKALTVPQNLQVQAEEGLWKVSLKDGSLYLGPQKGLSLIFR